MEFYFFPAASITQFEEDSFKLVDIYGGEFRLGRNLMKSYLLQDGLSIIPFDLNKYGLSQEEHMSSIKSFRDAKLIHPSKFEKESSFNRRKVLEQITSTPFQKSRTLNIGDITLELTQNCPYQCEGCFRELNNQKTLSLDTLDGLIDDLSLMGLRKISLSGGEVTASENSFERFKHVCSYAKESDIGVVRLLTTGFNPEKVRESLEYGVNEIQISVDGLKNYHDSYKKFNGAFERAVEAIKLCEVEDVKLTTNTVVTQQNLPFIEEVLDNLSKFNINTLRVTKIMSSDKGLRLNTQQARQLYETIKRKQGESPDRRIINAYGGCTNFLNCVGGIVYVHIGATGNIFACDYMTEQSAGNINEKSFQEIWTESPVFTPFRTPTIIDGECGPCSTRSLCFGNCRIDKEYVEQTNMCEQHNK